MDRVSGGGNVVMKGFEAILGGLVGLLQRLLQPLIGYFVTKMQNGLRDYMEFDGDVESNVVLLAAYSMITAAAAVIMGAGPGFIGGSIGFLFLKAGGVFLNQFLAD